jgi:hypothetical protein
MRILDPGHAYLLDSYDGGDPQLLSFMKREGEGYPGNLGHHPGTNCQEVIRALIARFQYLDQQVGCIEDRELIDLGRRMLWLLEKRSAERKGLSLGVVLTEIEHIPTCSQCGHITCSHEVQHA